jgi:putative membrane-bound dehydrogenase-like protein
MNRTKQTLILLTGSLMVLNTFAAEAPDRPIHVLYLGSVDAGRSGPRGGNGGGFGSRTNYAFLPGQRLAGEAIYFDHRSDITNLTAAYLKHFDAVVQAVPDSWMAGPQEKLLSTFKGGTLIKVAETNRPTDAELRTSIIAALDKKTRAAWEAFLAKRVPLQHEKRTDVPNYERRPEPVPYQLPLSARESMKYTQVPADFELQLFAAEPDIVKPIFMTWDERGRCWVVEAKDYPHGLVPDGEPGLGDIKILEDSDGDRRADKITIFADKLNIPTSMVFVNGGVIVSVARHFLFLKDTDGDDKADVRQTIFPNTWGTGDTHAVANNLGRGFDNWLYGAVGYSNFRGRVGDKDLQFGQGVYRFKADGSAMEFLYQFSNNTWGFGQNAVGDVFGSTANNSPSFFGCLPATILNPTQPGAGRGFGGGRGSGPNAGGTQVRRLASAFALAPGMRIHPNTPNVRQVDWFGGYTAAAGHAFMVSDALPPRLQGNALVCEPTCKLIGIMNIERDGGGYKATDGFNLLASTDEWMSPVFADVGPDGAVWVVDFYNFVIQHNPTPNLQSAGVQATTGRGGAYMTENNLRDALHGRIYRMVWKDGPRSSIKSLAKARTTDLVQALDNGSLFWRLTAQRLLVDEKKTDATPALQKRVLAKTAGPGAIHALWSLAGLGTLDRATHQAALLDNDPDLRRNAIRALPANETGRQLFFSSPVIQDPDLLTREAAFVKLAEFPTIPEIQTVVAQLPRAAANTNDAWLNDALTLLGRVHQVSGVGTDKVKVTAGDPRRGEELFFTSPTAACASCHTVKGKGGAVGPILDGIAVRSDKAYILESLMDPNAKLAKGFENLTISPMPPLGVLLKEQEVADILAFLSTLTTSPKDGVTVPVKNPNQYE